MEVFGTILQLLSLIEKQATVAPALNHLSMAAMAELTKINDEMAKTHAEKQSVEAKKAAEAEAKRAQEAAAHAAKIKVDELEAQKKAEADLRAQAAKAVRPPGEPAQRHEDVTPPSPSPGMRV